MHYDLIVIGSGPAGQKAAIAAAKLGKQVAMIERAAKKIGGVCLHTGTIPSKTIREAILHLTGYRHKSVYPEKYQERRNIKMEDLRAKLIDVINRERMITRDQLERNGIDVHEGTASLNADKSVTVAQDDETHTLTSDQILLAVGTKPSRPDNIPFDGVRVFDSDEILGIPEIPRSMIVVGGGVIGIEYALMFALLGVKVTVVDGNKQLLSFCDTEIIEHLMYCARSIGINFRLGEQVKSIEVVDETKVAVELESKKRLIADTTFFSVGRVGDVDDLNPAAVGLNVDHRGKIKCCADYATNVDGIFAIGDVIGFPSLASAAIEQGRKAVNRIFKLHCSTILNLPYGLYTIPEIAMVGKTEQTLTEECVPFEVGIARFEELAKPNINGNEVGMLKLLFHQETRELLGVHCIGEGAIEIIHLGQALIHFGGTIDYFCNCVFNHPTISEAYKVAAFDGLNKCGFEFDDAPNANENRQLAEATN